MKIKQVLTKKGIFVNVTEGMNGHNRSEVKMWRSVLDQSLRDVISTGTSVAREATLWVNSKPDQEFRTVRFYKQQDGKIDDFVETYRSLPYDRPGYTYIPEQDLVVDLYYEFEEVCNRANLDPDYVRKTWNDIYTRMTHDS